MVTFSSFQSMPYVLTFTTMMALSSNEPVLVSTDLAVPVSTALATTTPLCWRSALQQTTQIWCEIESIP